MSLDGPNQDVKQNFYNTWKETIPATTPLF